MVGRTASGVVAGAASKARGEAAAPARHVGHRLQPGLSNAFAIAVQWLSESGVTVANTCGGLGVGPVGSPSEQVLLALGQTKRRQCTRFSTWVIVAVGVAHSFSK